MDPFQYWATDWMGMAFAIVSLVMITRKNRGGFVVGVACNICWIMFGVLSGSLASICANILYAGLNLHGWRQWRESE